MTTIKIQVSVGFRSDVSTLLEKFSQAPDIRIHEFTKIWREMKFLRVFLYRQELEITLFTEDCFRILLSLALGLQPFPHRIGALFCLHSMYLTQPSNPKIMIRLVPDTWRGLQNLIEEAQLEPCENEVKYVFWNLVYQNAFLFVAKPTMLALVSNSSDSDTPSFSADTSGVMDEYMNVDNKHLKDLHNRYLNLKESLSTSSAKTVKMVEKDLFSELEENVRALKSKYTVEEVPAAEPEVSTADSDYHVSEDSEWNDDDDTFERRTKVRRKHQAAQARQTKSRRHRQVEEATSKQSGPGRKGGKGRRKRGTSTLNVNADDFGNVEESDRPFRGLGDTPEEEEEDHIE